MSPTQNRPSSPLPFAAACLAALLAAGAMISCQKPATDVGRSCTLVKRVTLPDGGFGRTPIHESELREGWDFISFGATGCEDFVCIRDKGMPRSDAGNLDPVAVGYCSRPCALSNPGGCAVSPGIEPPVNTDVSKMTCRAMLLDDTTVTAFCEVEPDRCRELFGTNRSPYFCARPLDGATSDGGTRTDGGTP